jgi:catalase
MGGSMAGVPEAIVQRALVHLNKIDPSYAKGVAQVVGVPVPDMPTQ